MAQDYIMRLVEQVARMLAAIIAHKKAGRDAEAALEIETQCRQTVGLPLEMVRRLSPEALWEVLQRSGGLAFPRAVMLAELLLQDADLARVANSPADLVRSRLQAFCLLAGCAETFSADEGAIYLPRLAVLASELEAFSSDPNVRQKLEAYRTRGAPAWRPGLTNP